MNLLLIADILESASMPTFGPEFEKHMAAKRHPAVQASSRTAWRLLEIALQRSGVVQIPQVRFEEKGRPVFLDSPLHFSLSHSGGMAVALLSDAPCAVDVESIRIETSNKLIDRCLNERERAQGRDFFECWTRKECIAKISGTGLPAHPSELDSLDPKYADHFHMHRIHDISGQAYMLAALCMNREKLNLQKIGPEAL